MSLPVLTLKSNADRRLKQGHLWIYSNEVNTEATPLKDLSLGAQVEIKNNGGKSLGIADR